MKFLALSILISVLALGGMVVVMQKNSSSQEKIPSGSNVAIVDGVQTIVITAKGGYTPRTSIAKANVPTRIAVNTNGTFDCSSSLVIPSLNIQKDLPPSGTTSVDIPPQQAGTSLQGLCGMGMYQFTMKFEG